MTGNTLGWVIVAFVLYLLMMIAIGAFYAKGNNLVCGVDPYTRLAFRRLRFRRQKAERLRRCTVRAGIGHERMAANGTAGSYLLNRCRR